MIKNARIIRQVDFVEVIHVQLSYKRRESIMSEIPGQQNLF